MPLKLPKIQIPLAVQERFKQLIATKGMIAALQFLCPIEVHFKIMANMPYKDKRHDLAILFKVIAGEALLQDPKDLEAFLFQLLAERGSNAKVQVEIVKHDGERYYCIFVDRP